MSKRWKARLLAAIPLGAIAIGLTATQGEVRRIVAIAGLAVLALLLTWGMNKG